MDFSLMMKVGVTRKKRNTEKNKGGGGEREREKEGEREREGGGGKKEGFCAEGREEGEKGREKDARAGFFFCGAVITRTPYPYPRLLHRIFGPPLSPRETRENPFSLTPEHYYVNNAKAHRRKHASA
jgi:hypothetical protein